MNKFEEHGIANTCVVPGEPVMRAAAILDVRKRWIERGGTESERAKEEERVREEARERESEREHKSAREPDYVTSCSRGLLPSPASCWL